MFKKLCSVPETCVTSQLLQGNFRTVLEFFANFFIQISWKIKKNSQKNSFKKMKKIVGKMVVKWSTGTCDNGPLTDCCWVNNNFFFEKNATHTGDEEQLLKEKPLSSWPVSTTIFWFKKNICLICPSTFPDSGTSFQGGGGGWLLTCFGTERDLSSFSLSLYVN